ncbi:hypothetical protein TKK_0002038 [Trichogramma kaykai]|uniref:RRM domain-containing protein n=1 Tax=Trichogramma kaykai TaxID=54128 RepID=A0ABD2X8M6_9HYME
MNKKTSLTRGGEGDTVEIKTNQTFIKQESANPPVTNVTYSYDPAAQQYYSQATSNQMSQQPLPGQPPLPPMPPPQPAAPPPPAPVFGPAQVSQFQAAAAAAAWSQAWQWMTPQPTPIQATPINPAAYQRCDLAIRNNYIKRERFNHNRNTQFSNRGNFYRNRNRRFDQNQTQFDQSNYYGSQVIPSANSDWQRNNESIGHMQSQSHVPATGTKRTEDFHENENKEEVVPKKTKTRKPMSQSYPSRPWNREDAERAIKIEMEYARVVRSQSLIIKFPDPDLNKDIVRDFHPGIQNIHFQSPSGPRYCFIQMKQDFDLDKAIEELEKIPFGTGHLKVERKSIRDEDNPLPEEIDPYTLYIGNLPESVNVNEVKSKFPTAARVDVGYAQKMRNTRYAFIRYNSTNESIAAYKEAHSLMWDTRSIIVRFRRQRGHTGLPGESKVSPKKLKDEASKNTDNSNSKLKASKEEKKKDNNLSVVRTNNLDKQTEKTNVGQSNVTDSLTAVSSSLVSATNKVQPSIPHRLNTENVPLENSPSGEDKLLLTEIKEEPIDYNEVEEVYYDEDDEDDEDDEGEIFRQDEEDDDDSEYEKDMTSFKPFLSRNRKVSNEIDAPSDHLDKMFNDLENMSGDLDF